MAVLDDHITPYRIPVFERLGGLPGIQLKVFYGTRRLKEREWEIDTRQLKYEFDILPNVVLQSTKHTFHEPRYIIVNPTLLPRLAAYNPDVVVGYAFSIPALTAFFYSQAFRKRFISWSTGTARSEYFFSKTQKFLRRKLIGSAHACLTASHQGVQNCLGYGAEAARTRVIIQSPSAAFREACRQARRKQETYARKMNLPGKIILFVGSLSERKGVAHLLEAFVRLRRLRSDVTLLLVGNGPLKERLHSRARECGLADCVHFAGFIQWQNLAEVYASADVFIFPTLEDNFGAVLAEAAGAGLPLISTPYAGATDHFVVRGHNGYVVDPVNHEALCEAIQWVFSHPRPENLASASAALAEKNRVEWSARSFAEAIGIALRGAGRPAPQRLST